MDVKKKVGFNKLPDDPNNLFTAEEKEKYNIISVQYIPSIRRLQCMTEHEKMNIYLNRKKGDPPRENTSN